jgi:hypothetical protein
MTRGKNIKKILSKWGKARLECVFNIERQNQCSLEKEILKESDRY